MVVVIVVTRLHEVIWQQAASTPLVADPLTAVAHNRSTVFFRWRQCARPSNTRFLWPTPLTIHNCSSIGSVVFALPMSHSASTLHYAALFPHKFAPLPVRRSGFIPVKYMLPWDLGSPNPPGHHPKRHHDRVVRFFRNTRSLPTDERTD